MLNEWVGKWVEGQRHHFLNLDLWATPFTSQSLTLLTCREVICSLGFWEKIGCRGTQIMASDYPPFLSPSHPPLLSIVRTLTPGNSGLGCRDSKNRRWTDPLLRGEEGPGSRSPATCQVIHFVSRHALHLEKGNGSPLQYSCLETPMDGGPWRTTVHGVAKRHN